MGKSTLLKAFDKSDYVSSDDLRVELYGTYNIDPAKSQHVWKEMAHRIDLRMRHGRFTIVDATNISLKGINGMKRIAENHGQETRILNIVPDINLAMNRLSRRRVGAAEGVLMPDAALLCQHEKYQRETPKVIESHSDIFYSGDYNSVETRLNYLAHRRNNYIAETDNVFVIGDIHGMKSKLKTMLDNLPKESLIFSLGDMIDRGEDSMGTIQMLMNDPRFVGFTMGNHEKAFLNELENGGKSVSNARQVTHQEFKRLKVTQRKEIVEFLKQGKTHIVLERSITGKRCLLTHAGLGHYDPIRVTYDQTITDKVNPVSEVPSDWFDIQIHGHMSWEYNGNLDGAVKNIDSGCGHGKELTAYNPFDPSQTIVVTSDGYVIRG